MPAHAPDHITDPRERQLYRDLSRVYEDYCGGSEQDWPRATESFVRVLDVLKARIKPEVEQQD